MVFKLERELYAVAGVITTVLILMKYLLGSQTLDQLVLIKVIYDHFVNLLCLSIIFEKYSLVFDVELERM